MSQRGTLRITPGIAIGVTDEPLKHPALPNDAPSPGLSGSIKPGQEVTLEIERTNGEKRALPVKLRIDTPIEIDYYRHGGILPFVLRQLLNKES